MLSSKEINKELEEELKKLDCFHPVELSFTTNHKLYSLLYTDYGFVFTYTDAYSRRSWLRLSRVDDPRNKQESTQDKYDFYDASFEEVFESLPTSLKEKLVFHLDIFMDEDKNEY